MPSSSPSSPGDDLEGDVPIIPIAVPHRRAAASAVARRPRRRPPPRPLAAAIAAAATIVVVVVVGAAARIAWCRRPRFPASVPHHRERQQQRDDDDVAASSSSSSSNDPDVAEREEALLLGALLLRAPLPATIREMDELNDGEFGDDSTTDPSLVLRWAGRRLLTTVAPELPRGDDGSTTTTTVAARRRGSPLVQVTSFGPTGLVILHLLSELDLLRDGRVPVVTLDTLHLFPQSYDFYDTVESQYGAGGMELVIAKPLRIVRTDGGGDDGIAVSGVVVDTREEFDSMYGPDLWKTDPDEYAELTKVGPLRQVLEERGTQMWITGRRRSSGGERSNLRVLEFEYHDGRDGGGGTAPFDADHGRWKLNPLAHWTHDRVWEYIRVHDLPYNVLYDMGYTSVGDEMTTALPRYNAPFSSSGGGAIPAIAAVDGFERSGRFVGIFGNRTECGLHSHRKKVDEMKQHAVDSGEEEPSLSPPVLKCDGCVDLDVGNFENAMTRGVDHPTTAQNEDDDGLLVEFYSPWCGGCQEFAPTLDRIAKHLSVHRPGLRVARFDITANEIPRLDGEEVFRVESTPALYRVRRSPSFRAEPYEGGHDFDSILRWLQTPLE
jgi:phosphoadenosine phosphosulfate reductase